MYRPEDDKINLAEIHARELNKLLNQFSEISADMHRITEQKLGQSGSLAITTVDRDGPFSTTQLQLSIWSKHPSNFVAMMYQSQPKGEPLESLLINHAHEGIISSVRWGTEFWHDRGYINVHFKKGDKLPELVPDAHTARFRIELSHDRGIKKELIRTEVYRDDDGRVHLESDVAVPRQLDFYDYEFLGHHLQFCKEAAAAILVAPLETEAL